MERDDATDEDNVTDGEGGGEGSKDITGYPLKGPNSHMGTFWR